MTDRRIIVANDHGGIELKVALLPHLERWRWIVEDWGSQTGEPVDYPDFALAVAKKVAEGGAPIGLLICGTGIGMCIAANKIPGIRAAVCHDTYSATMARAHNNVNVLCLGGRVVGPALACSVLEAFLTTSFEGGRHQLRLDKIVEVEA